MIVPFDILGYVEEKFKDARVSSDGEEVSVDSLFVEDRKKKLYINTETGKWICFKSGNKGNFIKLVSIIENISLAEAEYKICKDYAKKFLYKKELPSLESDVDLIFSECELIPSNPSPNDNPIIIDAWKYLYKRQLFSPAKRYFAGLSGRLEGRLVIPYEVNNRIIFFQARSLYGKEPRYLNCRQIKKSAILYPFNHESPFCVVTEGPIDAISLQNLGIPATCIMGASVSPEQIMTLKRFGGRIIVGFDNDEAGKKGLLAFEKMRTQCGMREISYIFPPLPFKDWNEAYLKESFLAEYIESEEKIFDFTTKISMMISLGQQMDQKLLTRSRDYTSPVQRTDQ